jgi:KDO2-lipid IV(A) lauroyltransferase
MYYFLKSLSYLPLWVLYGICDLIYLVTFYLVRWRRDIASGNIMRSFPEKRERERYEIMRKSYRNLGMVVAETIWASRQSVATMRRCSEFVGIEKFTDYLDQGKSVLMMAGHYACWEWAMFGVSTRTDYPVATVYKTLRLKGADRFMREARSKHGNALLISHLNYAKEVMAKRREPRVYALVADQTPLRSDQKYWGEFLNQDTAFFVGTDRLAHILKSPVFYIRMRRVKRGHYRCEPVPVGVPPYDKKDEYAITAAFVKCLEDDIREIPENWLWIHRKWKYERDEVTN